MSSDISSKIQNALWWITSIATAVVCCAIIFVLFASYFVDLREDLREGNLRINAIEEREDRILAEIEVLRKHTVAQPAADSSATSTGVSVTSPPSNAAPTVATLPPPIPSVSSDGQGAPSVAVPSLAPPAATAPAAPAIAAPGIAIPAPAPLPEPVPVTPVAPPATVPAPAK